MYSRSYGGQELNFEPSGGLVNSSLVMQDKQTDSYWSIMSGQATAGRLRGTKLVELPVSEKVRWSEWRQRHPDTLVLSIGGREYSRDAYASYWRDPNGFRGQRARDRRLPTKAPIFAFELAGADYAAAHDAIEGGAVFSLADGRRVFLYREPGAPLFASTAAFVSAAGFVRDGDAWVELGTGARFDADTRAFVGGEVERLPGFDTFWYTWSLNNPETQLLQ